MIAVRCRKTGSLTCLTVRPKCSIWIKAGSIPFGWILSKPPPWRRIKPRCSCLPRAVLRLQVPLRRLNLTCNASLITFAQHLQDRAVRGSPPRGGAFCSPKQTAADPSARIALCRRGHWPLLPASGRAESWPPLPFCAAASGIFSNLCPDGKGA